MFYPIKEQGKIITKHGDKIWYGVHKGIDIACKRGTALYACFDGLTFPKVGLQGGKQIWLYSLDNRFRARYMHLLSFACQRGQYVIAGTLIGFSDASGILCRGEHLHFDLQKDNQWVDPLLYLKAKGEKLSSPIFLPLYKEQELIREGKTIWLMQGINAPFVIPSPSYLKFYKENEIVRDKEGRIWTRWKKW